MSQCCNWQIDLRVVKTVTSAPPTGVGSPVVFNVIWSNEGPDRARNVIVADRMTAPASIGVTAATVVGLAYSGGATGPATTTYGALATGVVIPLMPVGSTVTAVIAGSVQALPADPTQIAFAGSVLSNTATGAAPGHTIINGDTGVEYLAVESTQVVVLPPECYIRCTDMPPTQAGLAGAMASAGVCAGVIPSAYAANGAALLRMRDLSWAYGGGSVPEPGVGGSYLTEVFTNTGATAALLEVDLIAQCNAMTVAQDLDKWVGFIHGITEQLLTDPPSFGALNSPVMGNFAYTQVSTNTPGFDTVPPGGTPYPNSNRLSPETGMCKYRKVLAPGQSIQLFYQWWAQFYAYQNGPMFTIHGGMATYSKLTPNVTTV